MNLKRLLLVTALLAVIAVPTMAQLVSGPESPDSSSVKAAVGHDVSPYRVVVGDELLKAPSPPVGYGSYVLIDGPSTEPGTVWYLEPCYQVGDKIIKKVRVMELSITTKQILGDTHPYLAISDEDIFKLIIKYEDPKNPTVDGYHNGDHFFGGFVRDLGERLINWYILKEVIQTIGCFSWNHTIGLAGPVGSPTWCINAPWKTLEVEEDEDGEIDIKAASPQGFRGWLELPLEPERLVTLQWAVTYKVRVDKKWRVVHNTGILDFDADGDKKPNWWEIENGHDPFDPNDPNGGIDYVDVPCVAGLELADGEDEFDDVGLVVDDIIYENSSTVDAGIILRTSPPCGTSVPVGSEVDIIVSSGSIYVSVPNLVGEWPNNVSGILVGVGLLKDPVLGEPEYSNTIAEGKVVHQWPVATTQVLPGSMVKIALSLGPQVTMTTVPKVTEHTVPEAVVILQAAQLVLGTVTQVYHPTIIVGCIISQTPAIGATVVVGSAVNVVVSKGSQPPDTAVVPSVLNKTEAQGIATLVAVDSRLTMLVIDRVYSSSVAEGLILYQDPVGGTTVNLPKVVEVKVSKGPQPPNVLTVTITSPADNFVGTVDQAISFACIVTGGVGSYDNFKWHFADNSFKYQQNVTKTFDIPGAGWCYIDVTDHAGNVAQDKVWVQINTAP